LLRKVILAGFGIVFVLPLATANLDFRSAVIVIPPNASTPQRKTAAMLSEEIEKRTNAYDAWGVPMWDQYIRGPAIFGTNTVELILLRSDDANDNARFPLTKIDMMAEMSRIAKEYCIDVSVWYPAMDKNYSDPEIRHTAFIGWGSPQPNRGGTLTLEWTQPEGMRAAGSGNQVSEVWLVCEGKK